MDNPKIYKVSSLLRHGAPKGRCAIPPRRRSAHVGAGPQGSWGDPKHQPGLKSKSMVPKISGFGGFPKWWYHSWMVFLCLFDGSWKILMENQ